MAHADGELLRALMDGVDDAIFVKDREGRYLVVNEAAARVLGRPPAEVIGLDDRVFFPADVAELLRAADRKVVETGETVQSETDMVTAIGHRTFLSTKSPYRDAEGRVVGVLGVSQDITEMKRAERAQQFLAEASKALAGSLDQAAVLDTLTGLAVPRLADRCAVDVADADGSLRRLAVQGTDPEGVQLLEEMRRRYPLDASKPHPALRVVATKRSELLARVTDDDRRRVAQDAEHLAMLQRLGVRSTMTVPLLTRGRVFGALTLARVTDPRPYDEKDLELAEELARRAALALDNARLYEDSQAQARRLGLLAEASEAFAAATLDLPSLYEAAVRRVAETLGDGCILYLVRPDDPRMEVPAVYHRDPEALRLAREHVAAYSGRIDRGIAAEVARTLKAQFMADLPPEQMRALLPPEYAPYVDRFGLHSLAAAPLRLRGQMTGLLVAWRDVTKRPLDAGDARLLDDLADRAALAIGNARLYRQAQEAIRARDEFLSIASHELRTPVTSIKGFAQVAMRAHSMGRLDEERLLKSLGAINRVSDRLAKLIEDLLDVSRMRTERLRVSAQRVDLAAFVNSLLTRYADQLDEHHRLVRAIPRRCVVQADPIRLDQVLWNVLENAVRYSPEGGEVRVRVACAADEAVVSVTDQGIGVPANQIEAIFAPFGRARNAEELAIPGMGLGLYICRGIVERLGGRIWAESPGEGKGTTVSIALPRRAPATARSPFRERRGQRA
ncbi:MAG TPA: ATP-binding protein [Chloroflexota bacterium]|nr:ATP-binding protein [Chloroflexota bacterium]